MISQICASAFDRQRGTARRAGERAHGSEDDDNQHRATPIYRQFAHEGNMKTELLMRERLVLAEETKMSTVTIGVVSLGYTQRRVSAAFRGKKQGARISFASEDLLWKTVTPKRWALLKLMAGEGSMAIREVARRAKRDVRAGDPSASAERRPSILLCEQASNIDRGFGDHGTKD
jgi:hypothetical protein